MLYKQKEIIGNATLYLADANELLPTLNSFQCIFYDPPFEIWGDFNAIKQILNFNDFIAIDQKNFKFSEKRLL